MKLVFTVALVMTSFNFAKADIASGGYRGTEVNCDVNLSFAKEPNVKSQPSVDMRVVSLPALKLSGKKIILTNTGSTIQCRNLYDGTVDGTLIISACSDHKPGEPLDIREIDFQDINPVKNPAKKSATADEIDDGKYFCIPKKSGATDSNASATKGAKGAQ